jgi:hypothetical protein
MAKGRRYSQRFARRRPRFSPRPRILIVCEGKVTEPTYFNDLKRLEQNRLIEVMILPGAGVPKTAVESAAEEKKAAEKRAKKESDVFAKYDHVWCVFDVDSHPNLQDAIQQARANNIELAISNPCFEIWILLHFQDQRAHIERGALREAVRIHIPGYEKVAPFDVLWPKYEEGCNRAIALERWQVDQGRPSVNPNTGVHKLTEQIRALTRSAPSRM